MNLHSKLNFPLYNLTLEVAFVGVIKSYFFLLTHLSVSPMAIIPLANLSHLEIKRPQRVFNNMESEVCFRLFLQLCAFA